MWKIEFDWGNLAERWNDPIVIVLVTIALAWMYFDIRSRRGPKTVSLQPRWVLVRGRRKIHEFEDESEAVERFIEEMQSRREV